MYIQVQWDGLKTFPNNAWFYSQSVLLKMDEECALDLPQLFNPPPGSTLRNTHRPRRGFPSFSHPLAVLFLVSWLCQCALTREKCRGEQMTSLSGS